MRKSEKDMTLGELLAWLRKRNQYRRRYFCDGQRKLSRIRTRSAAVFLLISSLLSVYGIKEAELNRKDGFSETLSVQPEVFLSGNPALSRDAVLSDILVTVGTEEPVLCHTASATVGQLLEELGCTLGENDRAEPSADTVLSDGMDVRVIRVTYETDTVTAVLPFETEYIDSQTIPRDTTELITEGKDGTAERSVRYRYENGVYTETEILSETVLSAPVTEQQYRGIGGMIGKLSYSYYIDVTATAYGPTGNLTYTGVDPHEGIIAVDPTVIPLHTKCYITGPYKTLGICYAEDIGGGIKGNKIDVFMDADYETLMEFGVRDMRVYILD